MQPVKTFQTDRLILKEITDGDIPSYNKYFVDWEIIRNLSRRFTWPYPEGETKEFLNEYFQHSGKDRWLWGIFLKLNSKELIGSVYLWRDGKPENRGFWLGQKFWNQGIMTEALIPITNYAFKELGFEKLTFANAVGNLASRRIKEKFGAKFVRTEPAQFVDPKLGHVEIWELSKEEWFKRDKN